MTPALALANGTAYALQVAVIVLAGLALPHALRLTSPRARLLYFRVLLAACFLLPLVQPWLPAEVGRPVAVSSFPSTAAPVASPQQHGATILPARGSVPPWRPPVGAVVAGVVACGILARFAWLAAGLRGLRRLRAAATPVAAGPESLVEARHLVGADADVGTTTEVTAPVTFGVRRPVILLPAQFARFHPQHQKAIACHELLHVRRRDWLTTVVEECVRSIAWFHPAIWILIDQMQLAREQLVDEQVVELLGDREPYLDALLRLVATAPQPRLRPAAFFLRKSHLAQRIALLLREARMSTSRIVLSLGGIVVLLAITAGVVVQTLPLRASPPPVVSAPALPTIRLLQPPPPPPPPPPAATARRETGLWPRSAIVKVEPVYPPAALAAHIGGRVIVRVRLEPDGRVTSAYVRGEDGANPLLAEAAVAASRQWIIATKRGFDDFTILFYFDAKDGTTDGWIPGPPPPGPSAPPRR